jgi:hypothetical protein
VYGAPIARTPATHEDEPAPAEVRVEQADPQTAGDPVTAAIVAATLGVNPNPQPTAGREPVINEALERAVRERMYKQESVNRGSCDYNTPMSSVKDLREREEDFPPPQLPETFRERYSFNGFSDVFN